jgi:dTDP-4-dehydrorhamnose 3,5-epimerase
VKVTDAALSGIRVIEGGRYADDRGWFTELWNHERYQKAGVAGSCVQTNLSWSREGVLRGMHFQHPNPQGKLVSVLSGAIFDVAVDLRPGSGSFGHWFGLELSAATGRQLWIPEGFAHGFLVIADHALVHYGCSAPYDPETEQTLVWNDPEVGIDWPAPPATISARDRSAARLGELIQRNNWAVADRRFSSPAGPADT